MNLRFIEVRICFVRFDKSDKEARPIRLRDRCDKHVLIELRRV